MNTLLTEEEVAKRLHVSLASIRRWRFERRGPQFIKVGSLVRYRPEDLESWLASLPTGGAQPVQAQATSVGGQRYRGTVKVMSS
ncbi:MAG: helix-turn-helix domain-containing protein [Bryobacterales bacterium]|nr:DNA-binding protein [Armatimonadota bacterium]MCZ2076591.1 helix-turn-helix domain-containing protein [Bryobacterales bacterium]MCZ2079946.1 helix-turn-helix domain-containing protein [Bryobacterales bacterium]